MGADRGGWGTREAKKKEEEEEEVSVDVVAEAPLLQT